MAHVIVDGCRERQRRDHNNRAWLAWHIAVLPNQRRMPSLKSLMIQDSSQRQQTWQQQMQVARMWTAALGGTVH